jgi:hypothetical protein
MSPLKNIYFASTGGGSSTPASATPTFGINDTFNTSTNATSVYTAPITNYSTLNALAGANWAAPTVSTNPASAASATRSGANVLVTFPIEFVGTADLAIGFTETGKTQSFGYKSTTASLAVSATPTITGGTTVTEGSSLTLNVTPVAGASYAWSASEGSITPSGASAVWTPPTTGFNRNATISCVLTEAGKLPSPDGTKTVGVTVLVNLEAPITSAMLSKYQLVFGFDRLKTGYAGNTVRLINTDTSQQQDFTFKDNGLFNEVSALAFANNSNIVKFYAMDTTGRELIPTGVIPFARSGVIQRQQIEASFTGANAGFIVQDNTKGVVGCDIDGSSTNFLACTNANIPSNCEITTLWSHKTRKQANNTLQDTVNEPASWGGTVNTESIVSIGTAGSSTNFISLTTNRSGGSSLFLRRVAANVSTSSLPKLSQPMKQWCANIATMAMTDTKTSLWYGGDRCGNVEGTTGSTLDAATGDTTGGSTAGDSAVTRQLLRVGRQINGPTGETTSNASMIFSGIIVTDPLTARERLTLHANWTTMCQAHLYQPTSYAHDLMQDYVLFGKATSGASNLAGEKGLFNIAFNTTTYNSEVPSWGYANVSNSGLKGLLNTLAASRANQFEDVGTTKVGGQNRELTTVSVIQWSPVLAVGSSLTDFYAYGSGAALRPYGTQMTGLDMQVAKDHNCFNWATLAQNGKDPNGLTDRVGPSYTNAGGTTTALYNGDNHPFFYRKKTFTRVITAETSALYDNMTQAQAKAWMATQDEPQHSTQGSFGATCLPQIGRSYIIITRIKPNASFVETGPQAGIDAFLRKATKSLVVIPLNAPCLATYDGFYAEEATQGATRVPNPGSRLVAHGDDYDQLTGHRLMFGVIQRAITDVEIHRLVTAIRPLVNGVV